MSGTFPVEHQQRPITTYGWASVRSYYGFDEALCAIFERAASAGVPAPTLSLSSGDSTTSTTDDPMSRYVLLDWLGSHATSGLLNNLTQQVHDAVSYLAPYYYDKFSSPLLVEPRSSGAEWPGDLASARDMLAAMRYTKNTPETKSIEVEYADYGVPLGTPYAQIPVPVTSDGILTQETVVGDVVSDGDVDVIKYPSNQRVVASMSTSREWCQTAFYKPCVGSPATTAQVILLAEEAGSPLPLSVTDYGSVPLTSREVLFTLTDLYEGYRYFLCGMGPEYDGTIDPHFAHVKELRINGRLVPQSPDMLWEVSHLIKCGQNTLTLIHYGEYSWDDMGIVSLLPVQPGMLLDPTAVVKVNGGCWSVFRAGDWMLTSEGVHGIKRSDGVSLSWWWLKDRSPDHACLPATSEFVEGIAEVTVSPQHSLHDQPLLVQFSAPLGATTYTATISMRTGNSLADNVFHKTVSSGPVADLGEFTLVLPVDFTDRWDLSIMFDTGIDITTVVNTMGSDLGDGDFTPLSGSVGAGTNCLDGAAPGSVDGECVKIYAPADVEAFDNCADCLAPALIDYTFQVEKTHVITSYDDDTEDDPCDLKDVTTSFSYWEGNDDGGGDGCRYNLVFDYDSADYPNYYNPDLGDYGSRHLVHDHGGLTKTFCGIDEVVGWIGRKSLSYRIRGVGLLFNIPTPDMWPLGTITWREEIWRFAYIDDYTEVTLVSSTQYQFTFTESVRDTPTYSVNNPHLEPLNNGVYFNTEYIHVHVTLVSFVFTDGRIFNINCAPINFQEQEPSGCNSFVQVEEGPFEGPACTSGSVATAPELDLTPPSPAGTSLNYSLYLSGSTTLDANGRYDAAVLPDGTHTGVWAMLDNSRYAIVVTGPVTEVLDYDTGSVMYSLSNLLNVTPFAANMGRFANGSGGGVVKLSENNNEP